VIAVVIVVVLVLAGGAYYASTARQNNPGTPMVTIVGIQWDINYSGPSSGYFGSSPEQACGGCPWQYPAGIPFSYWMNVKNGDPYSSHQITSLTVAAPFVRDSVSPALPITFGPSQTMKVYVNMTFPTSAGTYEITGTITTGS
jgi:hypothetical protein